MKTSRFFNGSSSGEQYPKSHLASGTFKRIGSSQATDLLFVLTIIIFLLTMVVGQRFYNQPQLAVNSIAPETIRAPQSASFIDWDTTYQKRKDIQTATVSVLQRDIGSTQAILSSLQKRLKEIETFRKKAGPLPYISRNILSIDSQKYLRSTSEEEWNLIRKSLLEKDRLSTETPSGFETAKKELKKHQDLVSQAKLEKLLIQIEKNRANYQNILSKSSLWSQKNFNLENTFFLNIEDSLWQKLTKQINHLTRIILTQGLPQGLPENLLSETIQLHLTEFSKDIQNEAKLFLVNFLKNQSNLKEDKAATQKRAQEAANTIKPIIVALEKGEIIVEAGQKITPSQFTLLDGLKLSRRAINLQGLVCSALLVGSSFHLLTIVSRLVRRSLRRRDYTLFFLLSLSTLILNLVDTRYSSLPAVGLLISSFYGPTLALTQVTFLTGLSFYAVENISWENLISSLASGLIAAAIAGRLRCRDELALLGLGIALTQGTVYLLVHLLFSMSLKTTIYVMMPNVLTQGLLGVAWAIIALGVSPYLERMFDLVTPIRLAELSHPNCPLLKRLAREAPGTFQHTLAVASLAEPAARALNCNVELVRAGTLYHDIGKMHDPLGFIENQKGGINKHDLINNPWTSAQIIKKHVSEGLVIARKYGLPRLIQDFIPQHQGTILIAYFYHQAKQQGIELNDADFRYDGPMPQSRETGIVMLADGCEAALRSLQDATPEMALTMVKKILRARWQEEQLSQSGLSYEELPLIAEVFVEVWQQFNHCRIAYPRAVFEPPCLGK